MGWLWGLAVSFRRSLIGTLGGGEFGSVVYTWAAGGAEGAVAAVQRGRRMDVGDRVGRSRALD